MGSLWKRHKGLVLAFVAAFGLAIYFGIGAVRKARDFDVAKEQPVAAWMTPRYISHSWDVPREEMLEILDLTSPNPGRRTLVDLAEEKGIPVETYIAQIEAGIAAFRAAEGQ